MKRYFCIFLLFICTTLWNRCSPHTDTDQSALCAQDKTRCNTLTGTGGSQKKHTLNIRKSGAGQALISIDGGLISCGDLCTASLPQMRLTLIATPDENTDFFGFEGVTCLPTDVYNPLRCEFDLSSDLNVVAQIRPRVYLETTISTETPGFGTLSSTTEDFKCKEGTCKQAFRYGDTITLKPQANTDSGSYFFEYQDDCKDSPTEECTLTLTENKKVTVKFAKYLKLLITVLGDGNGTIQDSTKTLQYKEQKDVTGRVIAKSYEGTYRYDTPLLLTATPTTSTDDYFVGFTDASQSNKPETFTEQKPIVMKKDQQLVAKFIPIYGLYLSLSNRAQYNDFKDCYVNVLMDFYGIKTQHTCQQQTCIFKARQGELITLSYFFTEQSNFTGEWINSLPQPDECKNKPSNASINDTNCYLTADRGRNIFVEFRKKIPITVSSKYPNVDFSVSSSRRLDVSTSPLEDLVWTKNASTFTAYADPKKLNLYNITVVPDDYSVIAINDTLPSDCRQNYSATNLISIICTPASRDAGTVDYALPILKNKITIRKKAIKGASGVAIKSDLSALEMPEYADLEKTSPAITKDTAVNIWILNPNTRAAEHTLKLINKANSLENKIRYNNDRLNIPNVKGDYSIDIESRGRYWHRTNYFGLTGNIIDFFNRYNNYYTITNNGVFHLDAMTQNWKEISTDPFSTGVIIYVPGTGNRGLLLSGESSTLSVIDEDNNYKITSWPLFGSSTSSTKIKAIFNYNPNEFGIVWKDSSDRYYLGHGNTKTTDFYKDSIRFDSFTSSLISRIVWMDQNVSSPQLMVLSQSGILSACKKSASSYSCSIIAYDIKDISRIADGRVLLVGNSSLRSPQAWLYDLDSKKTEVPLSLITTSSLNSGWIDGDEKAFFAGDGCTLTNPYNTQDDTCSSLNFKFLRPEYQDVSYAAMSSSGVLYLYY